MTKQLTNKRQPNIELIRIVATFFIVCVHYVSFNNYSNYLGLNKVFILTVNAIVYCCVDLFVLISGWFYNSKANEHISYKSTIFKICKIYFITRFYEIIYYIIFSGFIYKNFSLSDLLSIFLPLNSQYWFSNVFISLLLFLPILDYIICKISNKVHLLIVFNIFIFVCIFETFTGKSAIFENAHGYCTFWFICLYFIGSFLRKNASIITSINKKKYLIAYIILIVLIIFYIYFVDIGIGFINSHFDFVNFKYFTSYSYNSYSSIFVIFSAIFLFCYFTSTKINNFKASKLISILASVSFEIYLVHCNNYFIKTLYQKVFLGDKYYNSKFLPLHFVVTVVSIYIISFVITYVISLIINKPINLISRFISEVYYKFEVYAKKKIKMLNYSINKHNNT